MSEFHEMLNGEMDTLLKLTEDDVKWSLIHENNEGKQYAKRLDSKHSVDCLKIVATLKCPVDTLSDFVFIKLTEWCQESTTPVILEKYTDDEILMKFSVSIGYMIADRDFVCASGRKKIGDKIVIASRSVVTDKYPEIKGVVRGEVYHSGFVLEKMDDETTHINYLTMADPKGWIPGWMTNLAGSEMMGRLTNIKKKTEK
jgi:hypothetical protein